MTGESEELHTEDHHKFYYSYIVRTMKFMRLRWMNHVLVSENIRYSRRVAVGELQVNTIK